MIKTWILCSRHLTRCWKYKCESNRILAPESSQLRWKVCSKSDFWTHSVKNLTQGNMRSQGDLGGRRRQGISSSVLLLTVNDGLSFSVWEIRASLGPSWNWVLPWRRSKEFLFNLAFLGGENRARSNSKITCWFLSTMLSTVQKPLKA